MSNLLEQASLVMIPSGYKEDVVYSQIPLDGSGDMTLTRASNGTRVNSAGLVEVVAWNLLQYSEDITNAAWGEFGATRSANTATAPNGTTTADTILPSATTSTHGIFQQITVAGGIYSASAYFKANGYNYACIRIATNSDTTRYGVVISLIDGSVTATDTSGSPTNTSYSIETAGNGWFKLNVSCSHSSGFIYHTVGVSNVAVPTFSNSLPSFTANGTSSIYIWGAQLNIGSTAKPYFPTTDRLNVPRLTYQNGGGGCPSLLLEKQSTNLLSWSEDLTNAVYLSAAGAGGSITRTANYAISPDGTQNADRLKFVRGSSYAELYQRVATTIGVTYTFSFYAKSLSGTPTLNTAWNGTQANEVTFTTEWVRYTYTFVASSTSSGFNFITWTSLPNTSTTADILVWGAQLEASSYPTSYIPTTSSSATRVADACFKTGISSLIGQTEGVIFVDLVMKNNISSVNRVISITESNWISGGSIRIDIQSTNIQADCVNNNGAVGGAGGNITITPNTRYKIAFAYKQNDLVLYVNGTQLGTNTSTGAMPTCSEIYLNELGGGFGGPYEPTEFNQVALFPTRLTNAELASLTTI